MFSDKSRRDEAMAKKKIKVKKSQKKAKENKYFYGALLAIGGLLVIGVSATLLFGSPGQVTTGSGGGGGQVQNEITTKLGGKWRGLGVSDWQYATESTMLYVDQNEWASLSVDQRKERMNVVGDDFGKIIEEQGGDPKTVYIMFHDDAQRNMMVGTYSGNDGAQIQQ